VRPAGLAPDLIRGRGAAFDAGEKAKGPADTHSLGYFERAARFVLACGGMSVRLIFALGAGVT